MANDNKRHPSILGGSSLREKLSKAREELDALHEEKDVSVVHKEMAVNNSVKNEPKFHLTGRCNRKDQKYTTKAFYILDELDQDIKTNFIQERIKHIINIYNPKIILINNAFVSDLLFQTKFAFTNGSFELWIQWKILAYVDSKKRWLFCIW